MRHILTIKGEPTVALERCSRLGCKSATVLTVTHDPYTVVEADCDCRAVSDYFMETLHAPYPDGALLHYRHTEAGSDHRIPWMEGA